MTTFHPKRCKTCEKNEKTTCPYVNKIITGNYSKNMERRHIQILKHVTELCGCCSYSELERYLHNGKPIRCPYCKSKKIHKFENGSWYLKDAPLPHFSCSNRHLFSIEELE